MSPHTDPVAYWLIVAWFALILAVGIAGVIVHERERNRAQRRRVPTHPASNVTRLPRPRAVIYDWAAMENQPEVSA